jgi:hypothetical protein
MNLQVIHKHTYHQGGIMGLFKTNPVQKLKKAYAKKMTEAMEVQRGGDIQKLAVVNEEAESLLKKIQALEQGS